MKGIQAEIYLLGIVIIWGSTFAIIKGVLDQIPTFTFLAYRFLLATLILYLIFWKDGPKIKYKKPDSWINTQPEIFSDLPNWTPTKISKY